jgi:putative ABC transport system permease protein
VTIDWIRRLARRVRLVFRRTAIEDTLDAEIRDHLASETAELIRRGLAPDAARREALLTFGAVERTKEEVRDARGTRVIEDGMADVGYAARLLRRNRGFAAASIATLGLGIGIATSIFSVVYGVLLRPLPYGNPDRLVVLWESDVPHDRDRNVVSLENFMAWRERTSSFSGLSALMPTSITLTGDADPERVVGAEVSPGYFTLLGVVPALGRDFVEADARGALVTILSEGLWKRRFGGDPSVIGRVIRISDKPCTIVGVMPASFDPPRFGWLGGQGLWFPMVMSPDRNAWGRYLLVIGRVRDGVSIEQARAEVRSVAAHLERELAADRGWSATLLPLAAEMTGDVKRSLVVLLGAVGLLLVMAVTNVGMLTLSAMQRRGHELAVRRAIGATDRRLFRQLLVQSVLLAAIGSVLGLIAAPIGTTLLLSIMPPDLPRMSSIRVDAPVLAAATVVAMAATLVFGTVSAFRGRRAAPLSLVSTTGGDLRSTVRTGGGTLIGVEIALSVALAVMALLMVRSIVGLRSVDLGFDPRGVVAARVALPAGSYATDERQQAFFDELSARARGIPGVEAAGTINIRPLGGLGPATTAIDPANPPAAGQAGPVADVRSVDTAALEALGVRLITGAFFDGTERQGPARALVSRGLAQSFWPTGDAIGRRIRLDMYGTLTAEVIGVVDDVHLMDPRTPTRPIVYLPAARFPFPVRDVVIRTASTSGSVVPALRSIVSELDPSLPVYAVATMPELVDTALASDRFTTLVLVAFAVAALSLAAVGVFGVFAGDVTRRRREIGIRMALGAGRARVVLLLLRASLQRAAAGIGAGTALAILLARGMSSLLFGVKPTDPVSLAAVAGLVFLVAAAATMAPTLLAIRRSPLSVLREG